LRNLRNWACQQRKEVGNRKER